MRASNWKLFMRTRRLQLERRERIKEQQLEIDQKRSARIKINTIPSIIGNSLLNYFYS